MRKKLILAVLVLVLLLAVLLTRCGKKKETQKTLNNTDGVQQSGTMELREQKLGVVTDAADGGIQIETARASFTPFLISRRMIGASRR